MEWFIMSMGEDEHGITFGVFSTLAEHDDIAIVAKYAKQLGLEEELDGFIEVVGQKSTAEALEIIGLLSKQATPELKIFAAAQLEWLIKDDSVRAYSILERLIVDPDLSVREATLKGLRKGLQECEDYPYNAGQLAHLLRLHEAQPDSAASE